MSFDPTVSPTPVITVLDNKRAVWLNFSTNNRKRGRPDWLVVRTTIGNILVMHGDEDGSLQLSDDEIHFILDNNRIDWVHCCYPKRVLARFPRLAGKMVFPKHDEITYRGCYGVKEEGMAHYVYFSTTDNPYKNVPISTCTII